MAYSATGNLSQSEDLAQETFLTVWRQLRSLREPSKLRAWICGIARRITSNSKSKQKREPAHAAVSLDAAPQTSSRDLLPTEQTMNREEQDLLWRALEHIPHTYREPLVLFYREGQSVERVAESLEISGDAARQRLSRGRKLLHEQVMAFVEGALQRTAPGKAFTLGVLTALPMLTVSASAAAIGAEAVKGSALAKGAMSLGWIGAMVGPIVGILGAWIGIKASLENAESERERQLARRMVTLTLVIAAVFGIALAVPIFLTTKVQQSHVLMLVGTVVAVSFAFVIALFVFILRANRELRGIREEETSRMPGVESGSERTNQPRPLEYRTSWSFLGLPLIHVLLDSPPGANQRVAKGWIAVGDIAIGVLFAAGGWAVGLFSLGGFALGIVPIGGVAVGLLALGGIGLAIWSVGGVGVGYLSVGGFALGWKGAFGGLAVAREVAVGGAAYAEHANDAVAKTFLANDLFLSHAMDGLSGAWWMNLVWLPFLLVIWKSMRLRKNRNSRM